VRVFLLGFMGCGKSRNGYKLSRLMKHRFADTDRLVASLHGISVEEIFETKGEEYFRNEETRALGALCKMENMIVSTGGGLPCFNDNMKTMNENGITVYLKATPGLLFHRLIKNRDKRPLIAKLKDDELMEFIVNRLNDRKEFYMQAQIIHKADNLDVRKLMEEVLKKTSTS
jgi:shikimate kinase